MANYDYYYHNEAEIFNHLPFPRILLTHEKFRKISSEAKILYGLFLERNFTSVENGWLDSDTRNFIYYPQQEVQEIFGVSHTKVHGMMGELEKASLIQRKRQGLGLPMKIYVLNFSSVVDQPVGTEPAEQEPLEMAY
ncbi:MAG: replication initiator protein A [Eubacteriales bacterium]